MKNGRTPVAAFSRLLGIASLAAAQSETEYFDDGVGHMGQHKYAEAEAAF